MTNKITINLDNVDWPLLQKQNLRLVEISEDFRRRSGVAEKNDYDALSGIIYFLDHVQDQLDDDEEETQWFTNYYHHLDCPVQPGIEWEDEWDATCNDECPACGTGEIEPYKSEDL